MPNLPPLKALLFSLFVGLAAPSSLLAVADTADQTERILDVSIESGEYVIDSDLDNSAAGYDRDKIEVESRLGFEWVGGVIDEPDVDYRVKYRLLDPNGNPVLISQPGTTTAVEATYVHFHTRNYPNKTEQFETYTFNLTPRERLQPGKRYRVETTIEQEDHNNPGTYVAQATRESLETRFWHFTGTDPDDAAHNVLYRIKSVNWTERFALATGVAEAQRQFEAEVELEIRRYDDWDDSTPDSTDTLPLTIEHKLVEDSTQADVDVIDGNPAAPADRGSDARNFTLIPEHGGGAVTVPFETTRFTTIGIEPAAQLTSVTEEYSSRVRLLHDDGDGNGDFIDDPGVLSNPQPLLHFNGTLTSFSGTSATITELGAGSDSSDGILFSYRNTLPVIEAGFLDGHPDYTISTAGDIAIRLYDDGRAEVSNTPGVTVTEPLPGLDFDTLNGIRYHRFGTTLDVVGLRSDITAILPAGLGVYDQLAGDQPRKRLSARLPAGRYRLESDLSPLPDSVVITAAEVFYFVEESKPLEYAADSVTWDIANGRFVLAPPPAGGNRVRYVRRDQLNALEQSPLAEEDKVVRSNELYFRHLAGTTSNDPTFSADTLGSALSRVAIDLEPGEFVSHFPYGAEVAWDGTGLLDIVADHPVPASSQLMAAQPIDIPWARDCVLPPDANCGTIGDALSKLDPTGGTIGFTTDGGLAAKGAMLLSGGSRRDVAMGYIAALSGAGQVYAHNTEIFDNGSFLSAGHFMNTGETTLGDDIRDETAARLLNSGFNPNNLAQSERPGSAGYRNGLADYPGVNFRVADEATPPGATSTLGGVESPGYTLNNRSKYYARKSGVSGIHEPTENPFTDPLMIYGYEFTFSRFGLSFLSSEVQDSITAGSLYIPGVQTAASGFTVAFDPLRFSCLGGLTDMKLDGGNFDHRLNFWDADIRGISAAFQPAIGAECNPSDAYFTLGVGAWASNIAQPFAGTLGFKPDGNLITADDALLENVDSRLVLPSELSIKGPAGEVYAFYPGHHAYYDNFDHATDSSGGLNFAGALDVAYFEDLDVHFQVAAQRDDILTPIHAMGGWGEGGETHFTTTAFDLDHRGYPQGSNRTDYRDAVSGDAITAHQELFGVAELNYDVTWDTTTRSFRSTEPKGIDLLVISTEDECIYLSAEVAELDFGASIQLDIPEINFSNLAVGTPVYDALHAVADEITEEIVDGLALGEELLNDLMDEFYDDLFDLVVEPEIDALAGDLQALGDDAAAIEAMINDRLSDAVAGLPTEALAKVDTHIDSVQNGIGNVRDGLFGESGGRYAVAETVLKELVGALQPDTGANLDNSGGYDNLPAAFSERSGTLEQVKSTLDGIDDALESIQSTGHLAQELADAFADGTFVTTARDALIDRLIREDLSDFTTEEIKDILRAELRDALDGSALFAKVSEVLRAYLYELNGAMHEAIDSGFQQINRVIADLLDDFLPIDGTLRSFLGDIADLCFNGKVDGYARINGDALRTLRLDTEIQAKLPDPFEFDGYIEINQLDSSGTQTCIVGPTNSDVFTEVKMGAAGVPVRWGGSDLEFDIDTKFSFAPQLRGMAGAFEMTDGTIGFEAMKINELGAAAAFGLDENYLAAKVGIIFDGNRMYGGVFFGRTCTYDPLLMVDPDVDNVLPEPPLTGIYGYGEAEIPIVNVGCLFRVSARAGAGIFAFDADGTEVIGGKMLLGANGRVICAVNAGGEVELIGAKVGNDFNFFGKGRIYGCAGKKPLKVSFDKSVSITYKNNKWDYDY